MITSRPLFGDLAAIRNRRSQVLEQVHFIATVQNILWTSSRDEHVTLAHLQAQLDKYNGLEAKVQKTRTDQATVLEALNVSTPTSSTRVYVTHLWQDMVRRTPRMPLHLPGVDDEEIPIERLLLTVPQYEALLALTHHTHEVRSYPTCTLSNDEDLVLYRSLSRLSLTCVSHWFCSGSCVITL